MSIAAAIVELGRGRRHPALLENARLESGGGEAFGVEAIRSHFARFPFDPGDGPCVETATGFAIVGEDRALVGDLYDGHIARLWRLDPVAGEPPESAVSVPFDPDLRQARQEVFFRAGDHPELAEADVAALVEAGRLLVTHRAAGGPPPLRARAWLLRGFAAGGKAAGLFATHVIGDEPERRSAGFVFAAALVDHGGGPPLLVRDEAGEQRRRIAPWRPRLVP